DLQPLVVEDDLARGRRGEDVERGGAAHYLGGEIGGEGESDMGGARELRLRVSHHGLRLGGGSNPGGGIGRGGGRGGAEQRREGKVTHGVRLGAGARRCKRCWARGVDAIRGPTYRSVQNSRSDAMTDYEPPKVWTWNKEFGGRFASINRPISGATH